MQGNTDLWVSDFIRSQSNELFIWWVEWQKETDCQSY